MSGKYPTTPMCDGDFLELFEPTTRDTDIFIATVAKCGQTWLQTLLFHLKTRGHVPDLYGLGLLGVSPWLELPGTSPLRKEPIDRATLLANLEALDDPRVFKMHVVWEEIPRPRTSMAKIMTITRDPREVPYSMYAHFAGMKLADPPADFDSYFERWMEFGFYFKFVRGFWPHRNDPRVLWLRYEDMHRDLRAQTQQILDFLGWHVSPDDIDRALRLVDFKHMRAKEDENFAGNARGQWKEDGRFFREGAVGRNRARLNEDQERRILERAQAEFEPECFEFVTSLSSGH